MDKRLNEENGIVENLKILQKACQIGVIGELKETNWILKGIAEVQGLALELGLAKENSVRLAREKDSLKTEHDIEVNLLHAEIEAKRLAQVEPGKLEDGAESDVSQLKEYVAHLEEDLEELRDRTRGSNHANRELVAVANKATAKMRDALESIANRCVDPVAVARETLAAVEHVDGLGVEVFFNPREYGGDSSKFLEGLKPPEDMIRTNPVEKAGGIPKAPPPDDAPAETTQVQIDRIEVSHVAFPASPFMGKICLALLHNNGETTLFQRVKVEGGGGEWYATVGCENFPPCPTPGAALQELGDWMERLARAIENAPDLDAMTVLEVTSKPRL